MQTVKTEEVRGPQYDAVQIQFCDANGWLDVLKAISVLCDEVDFHVCQDGVKVRSMDPSQVAMVDFERTRSSFEAISCGPSKFRVNLGGGRSTYRRYSSSVGLLATLPRLSKKENKEATMTWRVDPVTHKLAVGFSGCGIQGQTLAYPTLDLGTEEVPTPHIRFNAEIKILASAFYDAIKAAVKVTDNVQFIASTEGLELKALTELTAWNTKFERSSGSLVSISVEKGTQKATFNLNYLLDIAKALKNVADVVKLEFSSRMPIRLSVSAGKTAYAEGLTFYLAPRIDEEEPVAETVENVKGMYEEKTEEATAQAPEVAEAKSE